MSQSDRAIKKLATQLARLDREVKSWRGAQADYTSIEAGTMDINDSDGNLVSRVGYQEDGSGAVRFFDGPTPPVPAGVTASADGPIIQATWDGTFEDGAEATYDLAYLEVAATQIDDDTNVSFATITAKEGASASVVADVTGDWVVAVRSVSQAGKKSEFATAGTVEVKLTDVAGAIEAVQDSANGKNKVTYSSHAPTENDPGIFDDTWFVGQVGRPNDIVEATNLARNPSFESMALSLGAGNISGRAGANMSVSDDWSSAGGTSLKIAGGTSWYTSAFVAVAEGDFLAQSLGKTFTAAIDFHLEAAHDDTIRAASRRLTVNVQRAGGSMQYEFATSEKGSAEAGTTERLSVTFTVPSDATNWNITAFNGSQSSVSYWDSFDFAEVSSPRPYFDGDTEDGTTDNESHYRWTGTPHASTSEKYLPALDIGESSNWNIIEQYRHDGTGWVKVELSHYVFSTVDLGKATVGELDGIRIMAKTISSEQLTADFADFMVARGATLIAGNNRHRLDDNGYSIFDDNGDRRTFLSPEGSTFKGEVEADTLVVNEGAEFKANNTLAEGASFTLAAGVTDPTAPPTVQPYWEGVEFTPPNMSRGTLAGLAFDGTSYWSAIDRGFFLTAPFGSILRVNATTGAVSTFEHPVQSPNETFGVTCIGSELFWLYRKDYQAFVVVTDLNCVKLREWEYPNLGYSSTNPLTYKPGIGNDGTNIVIAQCTDAGSLIWRTYNKTTGALLNTVNRNDSTKSDISGVYVGSADWGGGTWVTVTKPSTNYIHSFEADGTQDGAKSFPMPVGSTGVVYADGKWRTLDPEGTIHEYADINTGDNSGDWWAAYRWTADTTPEDESITNWSRISPPKRFTWPRRAKLRIIGQPLPTGVDFIGPSLAKKTTTPTRTDFRSPTWRPRPGTEVAWYDTLPTDWESASTPRDENNFPGGEPSTLKSANNMFEVNGDGSGRWGPLRFNADGSMSGAIASGQHVITNPTASTVTSVEITLPPGRFDRPPSVTTTPYTTSPQNVSIGVWPVTAESFVLNLYNVTDSTRRIAWQAVDGSE